MVYGVLYIAVEIVGNQLETVGWPTITPLDVATALTNALLAIVVCIAILVGTDLAREQNRYFRFRKSRAARETQKCANRLQCRPVVRVSLS